jgi:hypothetical protein
VAKVQEMRLIASAAALVIFGLAAWSLRPKQIRPIGSLSMARRRIDPFLLLTVDSRGFPRKYAWYMPVIIGAVFIAFIWHVNGT